MSEGEPIGIAVVGFAGCIRFLSPKLTVSKHLGTLTMKSYSKQS